MAKWTSGSEEGAQDALDEATRRRHQNRRPFRQENADTVLLAVEAARVGVCGYRYKLLSPVGRSSFKGKRLVCDAAMVSSGGGR